MSDQGVDPAAQQQAPPGPVAPNPLVGPGAQTRLTDGTVPPDVMAVTASCIRAIGSLANHVVAAAEGDARDAKDRAQAALYFAQAIITIDPSRLNGGATPEAQALAKALTGHSPSNVDHRDQGSSEPVTPKLPGTGTVDRDHDGQIGEQ